MSKVKEVIAKIEKWLEGGAYPSLTLADSEVNLLGRKFLNGPHLCKATMLFDDEDINRELKETSSGFKPAFITGYQYDLQGDLELDKNSIIFVHQCGYESTNSKEVNNNSLRLLHKELLNAALGISADFTKRD